MLDIVKIYGERNTGTTVLRKILKQNFKCKLLFGTGRTQESELIKKYEHYQLDPHERLIFHEALIDDAVQKYLHEDLGWKHACPPVEVIKTFTGLPKTLFIVMSKDPYAWLLSLHQRPYHQKYTRKLSFSDFLRHYWLTSRKDNLKFSVIKNPVCLYILKLQSYKQLNQINCHFIHIKYSDLLDDFTSVMNRLSLYLERETDVWISPYQSTKSDKLNFFDYQKKYQKENIMSQISSEDMDFIDQYLDWEILNYWNYHNDA